MLRLQEECVVVLSEGIGTIQIITQIALYENITNFYKANLEHGSLMAEWKSADQEIPSSNRVVGLFAFQ